MNGYETTLSLSFSLSLSTEAKLWKRKSLLYQSLFYNFSTTVLNIVLNETKKNWMVINIDGYNGWLPMKKLPMKKKTNYLWKKKSILKIELHTWLTRTFRHLETFSTSYTYIYIYI